MILAHYLLPVITSKLMNKLPNITFFLVALLLALVKLGWEWLKNPRTILLYKDIINHFPFFPSTHNTSRSGPALLGLVRTC